MEVARTSMIHAAAPHFLWPFVVRYAAHQLNLWPHVSLPKTTPTPRWTRKVGNASVFRVWGSSAFVRNTSTDKLSACAIPGVFLGFPPDAPGRQFYHPSSRLLLPSRDATFDESLSAKVLRLGMLRLGPGGAETESVEPGGAASEGAESGSAEPRGAASFGGPAGAYPRLSPQQLREWLVRHARLRTGGTGGTAAASPGGARTRGLGAAGTGGVGGAGAGDPTEPRVAGAGGTGAGGAGAGGAGAVDPGGDVRPRPYYVPLLQQVLGVPYFTSLTPPLLCPPSDQSRLPLPPASPLPAPSPYTEQSGGLTERREPASCPVSPVRTARRVLHSRPPPVPARTLWHFSTAASALVAELLDFAAACRLHYASPLVTKSASASPPSVGGECALGTDVLEDRQEDFECLVAAVPRFASMLLAPEGDPDALDIPTPRSYAEAITGTYIDEVPPFGANIVDGMRIFRVKPPPGSPPAFKVRYVARGFSLRHGVDYFQTFSPTSNMTTPRVLLHVAAQHDDELHSLDFSTAFSQGSLHKEIWQRRPPGFTGSFPAGTQWSLQRPVYSLCQVPREWHDTLRTILAALGFAPSTADPSLFLRTHTSLLPLYVLVYVDDLIFAIADTEALTLVNSELQKRRTCTDLGEVLQRFGFQFSSPQPTPLSTGHSLLAPPSNESVEPSGPYPELVGCLMYLTTCSRPDLAYPLNLLAHYVAPGRHRKVH
ncbi:unnamed protein product [Closterium sp. NIES-53]